MLNPSIEFTRPAQNSFASFLVLMTKRPFWVNATWLVALLAAMAYQTYLALNYNSNETTNTALIAGRIAAYNLLILIVILWLPVMRNAMSRLRYIGAENWFPLNSVKHIHRWLGHALFFAALLHGISYLAYFDSLEGDFVPILVGQEADLVRSMQTTMYEFVTEDESIDDVRQWVANGWDRGTYNSVIEPLMREDCTKCHSTGSTMTYAINSLPLTDYESVKGLSQEGVASRQFRINISGLVMWMFFTVIWLTSLAFMRSKKYHWFQYVHRLGYAVAILALLHIPRFEYCVLPVLLLVFEYYLNRKSKRWYGCRASIEPIGHHTVAMEIRLPKPVLIKSGHFVQIRIKQFSKREWHSISMINGGETSDTVKLIIKNLGDWTEQLYKLTERLHEEGHSDETTCEIEVDVRGFYASPMASAEHQSQILCVAGGIGITPVLSLINGFMQRLNQDANMRMEVVWVFQDWSLLAMLKDEIQRSQKLGVVWHLFATADCPEGIVVPDEVKVASRRPCLETKVRRFQSAREGQKHAFVCGPKSLSEAVKAEVSTSADWRLSVEHF